MGSARISHKSALVGGDFHFPRVYHDRRTWVRFKFTFTSGDTSMRKLLVACVVVAMGWAAVSLTNQTKNNKLL